jgi:hypothetical protein
MLIKQATGTVTEYPFSMMPDFSRDILYDFIPMVKILVVFVYIFVFIAYVGIYMFGSLMCALLGQVLNLIVKAPVTFGGMFKLTAYARTAPILLKMFFALVMPVSLHFIFFYALFSVYMTWALKEIKKGGETQINAFDTNTNYQ